MQKQKRRETQGKSAARGATGADVPRELLELIEISQEVGKDPDLVQGGGGNTSVKARDGKTIFVKASGTALSDMDPSRGWAQLDLAAARELLRNPGLASLSSDEREAEVLRLLRAAVIRPEGARPSVEASLHAILERVVIHVHAVHLNAFLCSRESREKYAQLFADFSPPPLYVAYVDPGYTLAARLDVEISGYRQRHGQTPPIVLLENHGVFVGAPETRECLELARKVVEIGRKWAGEDRINPCEFRCTALGSPAATPVQLAELRGALIRGGAAPCLLRGDDSPIASEFLRRPAAFTAARQGSFTPDQIVYCRTHPLVLDGGSPAEWVDAVVAYREKHGLDPRVILQAAGPGGSAGGVSYAAPDLSQLKVVGEVYRGALAAILRNDRGGGPRFLNREQAGFIEGWEVEHYRAALLQGEAKSLASRIAAVTGAGSGLGKGIALGLVRAGATVVALDISRDAMESVRPTVAAGKYLPVVADVTSEESIGAAFREIESSVGGLDIMVNAAGIAPPYPLVDFPLGAWRKTLEINLTGYFLCAREAARLFIRQGIGGSIINITSKSGLEASKDNSAYNATKAGEIHLMRGWALELGREGVRVNCVAPGNVFKGSQIWNDEYIRVCAKKKGIQPEEVIPYYTSLTALGQEIEPDDVANAVIFLASDEARRITGQTLVVDGGQVMVR